MHRLEFPIYGTSVRPQGHGATSIDIISQSKTMLPKAVLRRSEMPLLEKKSTIKTQNGKHIVKSFELSSEEKRHDEELKVQNIILNRI